MDEGEGIAQFEYTLDAQGRKLNAKEKFWLEYGKQENNIDWIYDDAGRLIYEKFDHYNDDFDQTLLWEYDLVSNRTTQKLDKGNDGTIDEVTKYTYDQNDRLLKEQHDAQNDGNFEKTTTYGYDHTQQTSKTVVVDGVKLNETIYEYNLQGRMSVVTITTFADDGTPTKIERTVYEYDEDGIRTSALHEIDVDGDGTFDTAKLTEYLNDSLNITGYSQVLKQTETDLQANEQTVTTYVIGHQRISQTVIKNGSKQEYYFTFDGHGSTRALTDLAGSIVELYTYDAFGGALDFDPATAKTEYLYSGEQFDAKIGQQYLRQRYYDPSTGRFNRLDPFFGDLNDPLSLHKYLYTRADSVNGIDPSGEMTIGMSMGTMALVGGISGMGIGAIRGGVQGALAGLAVGVIFAPITTLGIMGVGFGLAGIVGCSTTVGLGISLGIFTTVGASWNIYEIATAKNQREQIAACVSLVLTIGTMGYGGVKIYSLPKLPSSAQFPSLGIFPNSKGGTGTWFSEAAALMRGEQVVAREVSIRTPNSSGEKIRIDLVVRTVTGKLKFIESKNGPNAKFTANQKKYYPDFEQNGGTIVGNNGASAGLNEGNNVTNVIFQIDTWNGAKP
jgi:RHS repeat-associated protein